MSGSSESWPTDLLERWQAATITEQRAALKLRWHLRALSTPGDYPYPSCPLQRGLLALELAYRRGSESRGTGEGGV